MMYKISDGNATEHPQSWPSLITTAENWHDYMLDTWPEDLEFPTADFSDVPEGDLLALQAAIDAHLETLAEAMGHKPWAGHGNYCVSGLRLEVEEAT
jgi:hypothetical protein